MAGRHSFVSSKSDEGDASKIQPSDWNAAHLSMYIEVELTPGTVTVESALTERNTTFTRRPVTFAGVTQAMLVARQISSTLPAGAEVRIQWSSDLSTWSYLDATSGPALILGAGAGDRIGSWVTLSGVPTTEVTVRIVNINGNGTGTVTLGSFALLLR